MRGNERQWGQSDSGLRGTGGILLYLERNAAKARTGLPAHETGRRSKDERVESVSHGYSNSYYSRLRRRVKCQEFRSRTSQIISFGFQLLITPAAACIERAI